VRAGAARLSVEAAAIAVAVASTGAVEGQEKRRDMGPPYRFGVHPGWRTETHPEVATLDRAGVQPGVCAA
jgi:hypothetical protein